VHEIIEKYFKRELELFELSEYYEDLFDEYVKIDFPHCETKNGVIDLRQRYYDDGLTFLENFDGLPQYEVLGVEEDFTIRFLGKEKIHGFIDLVLRDKYGKIVIIDHKSHKFKSKAEVNKYAHQPFLYSLHIKQKYGQFPDRVAFNAFRQQEYIKLQFSEEQLNEALAWAKTNIGAIRNCTDFSPRFNYKQKKESMYFCDNICGFRESCERKYEYIDANGNVRVFGGE